MSEKRMGRPPGLTKELGDALIRDREGSLPDRDVALKNGVAPTTLRDWLVRGLAEEAIEPYLSFTMGWEQAKIRRKEKLLKVVEDAMSDYEGADPKRRGEVKAAIWVLERSYPTLFGSMVEKNGRQAGDIDLEELLRDASARDQNLDALLLAPPQPLVDALVRNADVIRDMLDELAPKKLPTG